MRLVLFVLIIALAPLLEGAEPVIMRIHHTAPLDHQITLALHAFALDVEERSNGRIDVDVVTKPRPMIPAPNFAKAVARGELEAACMPNFLWTGTIPQMGFSMIPYLFTEKQQMEAFPVSRAADYLEDKLAAQGVKTLAWLHVTRATVFTSEHPILEPGDFEGLRIRTMSDFARYPFEKVGGKPQRLSAGLVPAAIERGEFDAVMTDVSSSVGLELYELHESATLAPYFSAFYHLYVDPAWLDSLAPELRRGVVEAGETLTTTAVTITEARAAASADILRAEGVALHVQSPEEADAWKQVMQNVAIEAFEKEVPEGKEFLELLPGVNAEDGTR